MALQGFIDNQLPTIKAAWLNGVDVFWTTVFAGAATVAQALTALGFSAFGISLVQAANAAAGRTVLGLATGATTTVGTSATRDVGTAAGNVPLLDANGRIASNILNYATSARSSNTVLGLADCGTAIKATTTFTQTYTTSATLKDGWCIYYRNDGTGLITHDPAGGETIDGQTTALQCPGEGWLIVCDGSNFKTYGRSTGLVLINKQVVGSSVTSVDFAGLLTADFDKHAVKFFDVSGVTNGANLFARISQAGVFKSGGSDYNVQGSLSDSTAGLTTYTSTATSAVILTNGINNSQSRPAAGEIEIFNPSGTTFNKNYIFKSTFLTTTPSISFISARGEYIGASATAAQDGIRFQMSSGNVATGTFELYGVR